MTEVYYKVRQVLQSVTEVYYKVRQVLQSVTDCYYKVRQVLQSVTVITKWDVILGAFPLWVSLRVKAIITTAKLPSNHFFTSSNKLQEKSYVNES